MQLGCDMAFLKALKGTYAGRVYPLKPGENFLGRNPKRCDVVLEHHAVSREHARIETLQSASFIEDLGSRNGVWINGKRIEVGPAGRRQLKGSDRVSIGKFEFEFDDGRCEDLVVLADETHRDEEIFSTVDVSRTGAFERYNEREVRPGKLQAVLAIIEELSDASLESIEILMPRVIDTLFRSFPITHNAYILLRDPDSGEFRMTASRRADETQEGIRISRSVRDYVVRNRQVVLAGDVVEDTRFPRSASLDQMRVRSMISAPLVDSRGEVGGLIQLEVVDGSRGFTQQDLDVVGGVARHIATVIENARLHESALESQRQEFEHRFQRLVEGAPQGVLIHRDFAPLFVNDRWAQLFGRTVDDIERMDSVLSLLHAEDRERAQKYARDCLAGNVPSESIQCRGLRRDGSEFWFEEVMSVVQWEGGEAIQSGVLEISQRKRAEEILQLEHLDLEEQVRARQRELAESAALYRSLVDHLPLGVARMDLEGRYTFANDVFCRLVGKRESDIVGHHEVDLFPREVAQRFREEAAEVIESCETKKRVETFPGSDGELLHVQVGRTAIRDEEQRVIGTQLLMCDITAIKKTEEERNSYARELERSNRELEQFAYTVSHDLQSPLRTVTGYCELIRRKQGNQLSDEANKYLNDAIDGANRMKRLVDDLLQYSRLSNEPHKLGRVSSEEMLNEALSNLSAAIEETDAEVTHDELPIVLCDATQLMQVFQNLVGNAIRYRSHRRPEIHVSARSFDDGWEFSVRDNGVGIASEDFERIFQVFQRLYAEQEISGSGVGLALCKRIVECHGGRIWLESERGKGSTFFFTLPDPFQSALPLPPSSN